MRLLIIGGTRFLGRHLVAAALARGDEVTVFNRGQSLAPEALPAGVRWLAGDRRASLEALAGGTWDAVVDTCGYLPGEVRSLGLALRERVAHCAFISSVSAYADARQPNAEDAALAQLPPQADASVVNGETYGPLKAACEAEALAAWGAERCLLIRPGLIVGPHDPTGRFSWWPARLARTAAGPAPAATVPAGSPPSQTAPEALVLAPGAPDDPIQCIDARDLASFVLSALDRSLSGAFNLVSPPGHWCMADLLLACAQAAGRQPDLAWVDSVWLQAQGVAPWMDLPLWLPPEGEHAAFMRVPADRALAAGLKLRPLAETAADTLAWWRSLPPEAQAFAQTGLAPEREAELLRHWQGRASTPAG